MKAFYTNVDLLGNTIYCREIDSKGFPNKYKHVYEPTLFLETKNESEFRTCELENFKYLKPKFFDNVWEAKSFVKNNRKLFNIYGSTKFTSAFIYENYFDIKNHVDYSKISVAYTDIEVYSPDRFPHPDIASWPINAITTYSNITDKFYVFHLLDEDTDNITWSKDLAVELKEITQDVADRVIYSYYNTEKDLLMAWIKFFDELAPNAHTGFNSKTFDTTYLVNRIKILLSDEWVSRLSPWRKVLPIKVKNGFGTEENSYDIFGIADLDYLEVFKDKTFENQESYSLNHISHVILNEKKLSYNEEEGLHGLYKSNPQRFISYNIIDVDLILRLDKKLNLLKLTQSIAYYAGINYTDTYSPIRTWESAIYNHLMPQHIIPPVESHQQKVDFPGGYVKNPLIGLYNKLASFDLTSLYPSIIRQWNISSDTIEQNAVSEDISQLIVDDEEMQFDEEGLTLCGNSVAFNTKKQGFMSVMMENLFSERYKAKQEMQCAKQKMLEINKEISKRRIEN